MKRIFFKGTFLLVEGYTDARFFKKFIDKNKCKVKGVKGKELLREVVDILEHDKFNGILGILDADFDHLEGNNPNSINLFLTDLHDMETVILKSPALDKFLTEYTDETNLRKFISKERLTLRQILLRGGIQLGHLRWIALKNTWFLRFKKLNYQCFVVSSTLEINQDDLIAEVLLKSSNVNTSFQDIKSELTQHMKNQYDSWQISCGHDLINILLIGLKEIFGYNISGLNSKRLEANLRLII